MWRCTHFHGHYNASDQRKKHASIGIKKYAKGRIPENMEKIYTHLSLFWAALSKFMERHDREYNLNREVSLLQYLSADDVTMQSVLLLK